MLALNSSNIKPASLLSAPEGRIAYPGLDRIAHQLGSEFAALLLDCGLPAAKARWTGTSICAFDDLVANSAQRIVSAKIRMAPLRGHLLITMPIDLVSMLTDYQFGGDGSYCAERTSLTRAEYQSFHQLANGLVTRLKLAWKDILAIEPSITKLEISNVTPSLVAGLHKVVDQSIKVQTEYRDFDCNLIIPVAMLRNLPQLTEPLAQDNAENTDPDWQAALTIAVMQMYMPVRTIFARPEIPFEKLMALSPGDIIPVSLPELLPITIAGRLFANGSLGSANGRAAIKIEAIQREG